MGRGGGKTRRRPKRRQSSRGWLLATLALPVLVLAAFHLWSSRGGQIPMPELPSVSAPAASVTPPAGPPTDWDALLRSAGVEDERIQYDAAGYRVETPGGAASLEKELERIFPEGTVSRSGSSIRVTDAGGRGTSIYVQPLRTEDSGVGLVEADEEADYATDSRPGRIVLILDDVGFDRQPLERAAELDPDIAFAVIPTASKARQASNWLESRGFETLCHLPMEPIGYPRVRIESPAILVAMDDESIRSTTREALDSLPHVRGLNNHMGSRASSDPRVMRAVLEVVHEKGLYFVDSRTASASVGESTARQLGVRSTSRQVFLDDDPSVAAVRRQLRELERRARADGLAIGIGHVLPTTVAVLEQEVPRLRAAGIDIVRPSTVVR